MKHGHHQTSLRPSGTVHSGHSWLDLRVAQAICSFVRRITQHCVSEVEQEYVSVEDGKKITHEKEKEKKKKNKKEKKIPVSLMSRQKGHNMQRK